jgi:hypothetical protein
MITICDIGSGVLLAVTAWLFDAGVLTALTQTIAWVVVFFLASAGASAAYLTVSEIFPLETRALAIAFFYAVGTGIGGIIGPVLYGHLIATKRPFDTAVGYLIGAGLMIGAGIVEMVIGVNAEQKSLEELAEPLSATSAEGHSSADEGADGDTELAAARRVAERQAGPSPIPRPHFGTAMWAPLPQASDFPRDNPSLAAEVDAIVAELEQQGSLSYRELTHALASRSWGPGRLRQALRSGLASGRVRKLGRDRYLAGSLSASSDGRSTSQGTAR